MEIEMDALLFVSAWFLCSIFIALLAGRFLSFSCGVEDAGRTTALQRLVTRRGLTGNTSLADACGDRSHAPSVPS